MTFDQLRYFVLTADEKSMMRAADKLFITRQTLSGALNSLEEDIGVQLLKRSNQGVELTDEGSKVYTLSRKAVGEYDKAASQIRQLGARHNRRLRIAVVETTPIAVTDLLVEWGKTCEKVDVSVLSPVAGDLSNEMMRNGQIDIVYTTMPNLESKDYYVEQVGEFPLEIWMGEKDPLAEKTELSLGDFKGKTFINLMSNYGEMEYAGEKWMAFQPGQIKYTVINDFYYTYQLIREGRAYIQAPIGYFGESFAGIVHRPCESLGVLPVFLRISHSIVRDKGYDAVLRSLTGFLKERLPRIYL